MTLLELATNGQHPQAATNIIFAAALQRVFRYVEASWDETFTTQRESTEVHLAQWESLRALHPRVASLERTASTASPVITGANPTSTATTTTTITTTTPALDALDSRLANIQEAMELEAGNNNEVDEEEEDAGHSIDSNMARVLARIRQVREMRQEGEAHRFERMDEQRQARVIQLAENMGALRARIEALEMRAEQTARNTRELCNFLIAHVEGDLNRDEVSGSEWLFWSGIC